MDKGVITFSLREYIREKRYYMKCNISSLKDKSEIFISFLNINNVVLSWDNHGVHIHPLHDDVIIDKHLYLTLKTRLYLAASKGEKECTLPLNLLLPDVTYWLTVLRAIHSTRKNMYVHAHLISLNTVRIRNKLL